MKKTTRSLTWMVALSATLIGCSLAGDYPVAERGKAERGSRFEAMASRLNLTVEQKEQLKAHRETQQQAMMEMHRALKEKRAQFKQQLDNPDATRESVNALAADIKTLTGQMIDQRIDAVFAVRQILTPDQFNQLRQAMQQRGGDEKGCRPFWLGKRRANNEENNQEE